MRAPPDPPSNRLAAETSPYLRQHATNPVAWWPWSESALNQARTTGKPILLSIGYSACHWCHVMANESFEDPATAAVMNEHFINIKVDREERPDIDKIYQLAHQLLVQRPGGWPLTMFLMPEDQTPFFGGTYFPPEPRYGMPAFKELCLRVVDFLAEHGSDIHRQNHALREALLLTNDAPTPGVQPALSELALEKATEELGRVFDPTHGGFGRAPKFPHPTHLERLLRAYVSAPETASNAKHMLSHTLSNMADGGIYDQIGGGFFRYSVDDEWTIPHFEKMLYDNGPLLGLYTAAYALDGNQNFRDIALGVARWVIREMQSAEGGYYSTLDADAEGEEGKFYLWNTSEIATHVTTEELSVLTARFGLDRPANFEDTAWHLRAVQSVEAAAQATSLEWESAQARLTSGLAALFEAREHRVRPERDEKVLVSWNALMITAMARGTRYLGNEDLLRSAELARDFLFREMWSNGRLHATYIAGQARLNGYLDDYAFLLEALLELLSVRWRRNDLDWAIQIANVLLEQFEDPAEGGFFFTANDHERLLHRSMPFMDDALPAGNAAACRSLLRLGHLIGDPRYLEAARRSLERAWAGLLRAPHAHSAMLHALEDCLAPPAFVILRGDIDATRSWREALAPDPSGRRYVLTIPSDESELPGLLNERAPRGHVTAYVCNGLACEAPQTELDAFRAYASNA